MSSFKPHSSPYSLFIAMLPILATPAEAAYQFYMDSFVVAKDFTSGSLDPMVIFAGANIRFEDEFDAGGRRLTSLASPISTRMPMASAISATW